MKFELTDKQKLQLGDWLHDVYPKIIATQKLCIKEPNLIAQSCWDNGFPYEGATGGGLTYNFTPTSIGVIVTVDYHIYNLDLTDYESW